MTPKIFDRIYAELKREVTSGRYAPGQRLQARAFADTLQTSTSPVTLAMRQMVGEDILHYVHQDGFIIPRVTERRLRDLYSWSLKVALSALADVSDKAIEYVAQDTFSPTEFLFAEIGAASENLEVSRAIANINDRLRGTRHIEAVLFHDIDAEFSELSASWTDWDLPRLQDLMTGYHRRRLDAVPQLVSLSYRDSR